MSNDTHMRPQLMLDSSAELARGALVDREYEDR